ncbi:C2H2 finger domain-containing protein [Tothia fuscella]|uniref:C2H2 finger domain-containing protein n=1 Tax=Tothia fuscella TaxID=1048955 RepID=A0A9P4NZ84_9PEZI|nr:C2H2 finger domain-containing protein [Tothia fuscella]
MPAIRGSQSKKKTRRHTRDIDEISEDLKSPRHLTRYQSTKHPEDLPALGAHYCTECAKWFESEFNMISHKKGKGHKRQLKQIKQGAHTQREAEEAAGLRVDNGIREKKSVDEEMVVDEQVGETT